MDRSIWSGHFHFSILFHLFCSLLSIWFSVNSVLFMWSVCFDLFFCLSLLSGLFDLIFSVLFELVSSCWCVVFNWVGYFLFDLVSSLRSDLTWSVLLKPSLWFDKFLLICSLLYVLFWFHGSFFSGGDVGGGFGVVSLWFVFIFSPMFGPVRCL